MLERRSGRAKTGKFHIQDCTLRRRFRASAIEFFSRRHCASPGCTASTTLPNQITVGVKADHKLTFTLIYTSRMATARNRLSAATGGWPPGGAFWAWEHPPRSHSPVSLTRSATIEQDAGSDNEVDKKIPAEAGRV